MIERAIPFRSLCEHHFLPFTGLAHVAYLPGERILGLSKLARVVELFAHRPQVQERLTQQVADWLDNQLRPDGVGVVLVAEHLCMTLRSAAAAMLAMPPPTIHTFTCSESAVTFGPSVAGDGLAGEGPERAVVFGGEAGLDLRPGRDQGQHRRPAGIRLSRENPGQPQRPPPCQHYPPLDCCHGEQP